MFTATVIANDRQADSPHSGTGDTHDQMLLLLSEPAKPSFPVCLSAMGHMQDST